MSSAAAAAAAREGGSGGLDSAFGLATSRPLLAEENGVREALGLPPTGAADTEEDHVGHHDRHDRPSHPNESNQGHRHRGDGDGDGGNVDGFGGLGGGRSEGESESERKSRQMNQAPGRAPLCLLLSNLGELFRWDVAAAADICADAFPGVRPW